MNFIKYFIGVFLFIILLTFVDINELNKTLLGIKLKDLINIFLISFIFLISQALRLHMLIYQYVQNFYETAKLCFVSQFFSNFLPGGLAGDFYKVVFLKNSKLAISSAIAKIGIDRISGSMVLLIFSAFYFGTQSNNYIESIKIESELSIYWLLTIFALFSIILILIQKYKTRIYKTLIGIKKDLAEIKKLNVINFLILCVLVFFIRLLKFQIIFTALQYNFNFIDLIFLAFISQVAAVIPISIGGLGVIEASLFYGLRVFGVPESIAIAFVLINRFTIWIVSIVGGLYWLILKKNHSKKNT